MGSVTPPTPKVASHPSNLTLVGGGPRTAVQVNSEVSFMLLYHQHFEELMKLGAQYDISTTIIEKQPSIGAGTAYNDNQTGMMNTGVEDDISFPLAADQKSDTTNIMKYFLSYQQRYEKLLGTNFEEYFQFVKSINLPGAVMFRNSVGPNSTTKDSCLEHQRAYLLRGTVGKEETHTTETLIDIAKKAIPFYSPTILTQCKVSYVDLQNSQHPQVVVKSEVDNSVKTIESDEVRLNCGTTTRSPIDDPALQKYIFCQAMNAHKFYDYCKEHQLLDSSGLLKSGTKIISGGLSLSELDQLSVLDHVMHLFEEDDSVLGFKVSEEAKEKYQSSITLINRTPGNICMPRHSFSTDWTQDTSVMGDAKHIHALFLHNFGEEVYRAWFTLITAAVARAAGKTMSEARCENTSTINLLRSQFEDSKWFMKCRELAGTHEKRGYMDLKKSALKRSTQTLYGAWREAALGTIFGLGIQTDPESTIREMGSFAPITWRGREFWLFHRGQIAAVTDPRFSSKVSNKDQLKNFDFLMKHITSSPVEMHSMIYLLMDAGIAQYETASYDDIKEGEMKDGLQLHGEPYDLFIVSPVFDSSKDKAAVSLAGQVKPMNEGFPRFGKVGKFRRFVDEENHFVPVEDFGLGGKGFKVKPIHGTRSGTGSYAVDTNNRSSAVSVASSVTMRRIALAHLNAAGVANSQAVLDEIYNSAKPSQQEYGKEVRKFEEYFSEALEMCAYIEAITLVSGDNVQTFRTLYDTGLSADGRKRQMETFKALSEERHQLGGNMYFEAVRAIPNFKPPTKDEYLDRFVDTTEEEDVYMYNEAFKLAKRHLQRN